MKATQKIFIIIISLFIYLNIHPEDRMSIGFLNETEKEAVIKGKIITKTFLKYHGTIHNQNADSKIDIPKTQYIGDIKDYEMLCIEKAFFKYNLNEKSRLTIFNTLAAVSKLEGTEYYSKTDKKIIPFIIKCYPIDPENKILLKDPSFNTVPVKAVNYFKATDNRFGQLLFRSEIYTEGDNFILKNICVQPMRKNLISINNKEEYQLIYFFIYDNNSKGYFYYAINAMRIKSDFFLRLQMLSPESFANRIRGSTVRTAKLLGLNWRDKLKAFE